MTAKADLHVHSKASNRPSEWILRQLGAPESFTEPREVYRRCRERGMAFVTISDHDTIEGALEIAHLPGTFLSCEVTAEFPEDGCEVHILAFGITEEQHREIQSLRRNLYELRDWFRENGVLHSVAHPLFRVNDRLTLKQVEKLMVLFNRFEALNGAHDRRANDLVRRVFGSLTPEVVFDLAERHGLEPLGPTPWEKYFTGGSDDHGGLYIATTHTETPAAASVEEYLAHLREGRHQPGGQTGSTARLVQSLYSIAHEYYRRQFPAFLGNRNDPFARLLRALAQGGEPEPPARGLRGRLAAVLPFRKPAPAEPPERSTFGAASRATEKALARLLRDFFWHARCGRLAGGLAALSHAAPLAVAIVPYLVAVHAQHKDADLLESSARRFLGETPEGDRPAKVALFADPAASSPALDRALHAVAGRLRARGASLTALTCGGSAPLAGTLGIPVHELRPLLDLSLPGAGSRRLRVPPPLDLLDHCERERYSELLVATPGPLGLAALAAGKLLGIRVTAIHHQDFAARVRHLSGSDSLGELAWAYARWLYGQSDEVRCLEVGDLELLARQGIDRRRLAGLAEGLHPERVALRPVRVASSLQRSA